MEILRHKSSYRRFASVAVFVFLLGGLGASTAFATITFTSQGLTSDSGLVLDASNTISLGTSSAAGINFGTSGQTQSLNGTMYVFEL
jgi:hypothetical protein